MLMSPMRKRVKSLPDGIDLTALNNKGKAQKKEILIRRQAISTGENPTSPFFMSMYEEPHIRVSNTNNIQFCRLFRDEAKCMICEMIKTRKCRISLFR